MRETAADNMLPARRTHANMLPFSCKVALDNFGYQAVILHVMEV